MPKFVGHQSLPMIILLIFSLTQLLINQWKGGATNPLNDLQSGGQMQMKVVDSPANGGSAQLLKNEGLRPLICC